MNKWVLYGLVFVVGMLAALVAGAVWLFNQLEPIL